MEWAGGAGSKTNANAAVRHDKILEVGKDTAPAIAHPCAEPSPYLCSMERQLSEQEQFRRQALADLRAIGLDPYPAAEVPVTHLAEGILNGYPSNPEAFTEVCVAGRLMAKRIMGKASFASIQDSSGRIQAYVNRDEVCPGEDKSLYNDVFKKHLDLGTLWPFMAMFLPPKRAKSACMPSA